MLVYSQLEEASAGGDRDVADSRGIAVHEGHAHRRHSSSQGQDGGDDCPDAIACNERGGDDGGEAVALHPVHIAVDGQDAGALHQAHGHPQSSTASA